MSQNDQRIEDAEFEIQQNLIECRKPKAELDTWQFEMLAREQEPKPSCLKVFYWGCVCIPVMIICIDAAVRYWA